MTVSQIEDAAKLADSVAAHLSLKISDKQELLETNSLAERLEKLYGFMEAEISVLQVEKRIRGRVKRQMEKTQREYYLNEQMKAIQKELGELEDGKDEASELEERIKRTKLSKEARDKARGELKKLRTMSPMSAEATVVRNYLDWLLSIPWKKRTKVSKDIRHAQGILDADHYGLEKVKERIVEYLAVQQRVDKMKGPILCLVGPPGVGKTLARQVAGQGHRPQLRPLLLGRRARRGRDPRPSPDLYRLAPGQDHPEHEEGQEFQPALHAGRGRQDGLGLPGRPGLRPPRGPGSGAEPELQRPLPGGRLRSVGCHVRLHRQHLADAAAAHGPHGDHPARRLHRGREGRDRQAAPDHQAAQGARPQGRRMDALRRWPDGPDPLLHARGGRALARA